MEAREDFGGMIPQLEEYLGIPAAAGGKRRYRGGVVSAEMVSAFLDLLGEDRVAFGKAVVLWVAYNAGDMAQEAAKAAVGPTREYLESRLAAPLGYVTKRVLTIAAGLADQIFQLPVTALSLSIAGAGFTANFASHVIGKANELGRKSAAYLLSDETAKDAADAATNSIQTWTTTAGLGAVVLNQMGVLPLSAILAAIIVAVQAQVGTGGGRAYLVSGFYAWYKTQSDVTKTAIKKTATGYAKAAADSAKASVAAGAAVAGPALKAAASRLATQLQLKGKGGTDGKNAVQAMVTGEGAPAEPAKPAVQAAQAAIASENGIADALQNLQAVAAAALAASVAEEVQASKPADEARARRSARVRARAPLEIGRAHV
jgi:hypothetical protein